MVEQVAIVFPHQLYLQHPALVKKGTVYIIEDPRFFSDREVDIHFHKQKLLFHRASMKRFAKQIEKSHRVIYIPFNEAEPKEVFRRLQREGVRTTLSVDPTDHRLQGMYEKEAKRHRMEITWLASPNFLCSATEVKAYFQKQKWQQTPFYITMRKRLGILVEEGKPVGGKWTFDTENRKKLPASKMPPEPLSFASDSFVEEAASYVEKHFSHHVGDVGHFIYPTSTNQAEQAFSDFLSRRFKEFGPYQDALTDQSPFVYHSLLSMSLNAGLLKPDELLHKTLLYVKDKPFPLASLEGFFRQIIGWREFIRAAYLLKGETMRQSNFFSLKRKLGPQWYQGSLGIAPVDTIIQKVIRFAYGHHIERLMGVGNIMLLCEVDPKEVYRWFMEMFIDSYDWVMVPNVFGMSQFSDGGTIVTKPYISGSHYIRKMSNDSKGPWCEIWDGLYWRFLHKYQDKLSKIPRMQMMYQRLEKMDTETLKKHRKVGDAFIAKVTVCSRF